MLLPRITLLTAALLLAMPTAVADPDDGPTVQACPGGPMTICIVQCPIYTEVDLTQRPPVIDIHLC